jgi:hemoglobin
MVLYVTEERISNLVDAFYEKVRLDREIGPFFNAVVSDWPHHLSLLKDFWSTVLLTTGRYKGDPMMRHLKLGLDPQHFARWLTLFDETAHETFPSSTASFIIAKSHSIASSFQAGDAYVKANEPS